jgi:hypothetical protein
MNMSVQMLTKEHSSLLAMLEQAGTDHSVIAHVHPEQ